MARMMLLKVYRYVKKGYDEVDNRPLYSRVLYDAIAFSVEPGGGLSSVLGDNEEFEVYIEELT